MTLKRNTAASTWRRWPDSPVSKPGGVKRSNFGWDSNAVVAAGTQPCTAPNRRNSPTTVMTAFAVPRDR
ncbi:hypothetical protein [Streptomyces sp. NBC_00670]|uniref:hypothetical protein n=1 Tax=Streptomyces sp. NBC_00670 TaxID=2975804 RepID=UPI002E30BFCB|nr:hypothetical protein [Streptomyces sp. NBC_00670]